MNSNQNKKFYLSTAIPYTSAIPHIGNVYEIILADAVCRFKRLDGFDVFFLTGTDEHGLKIQQNAEKQELEPQAYVDFIADEIKRIYKRVGITYDHFIRTTDQNHKEVVKKIFEKLHKQGDIYLGKYEGWYSIADESYISEDEIIDGKGPSGDVPIWMSEEAYFLKLSKYQERLVKHIKDNPDFIQPESRKNEIVNMFLQTELTDLSISRTSFDWGIQVPFDPKHVVYVWIDALSNYITGLGYDPSNPSELFNKYWPANFHVIGKDVLRFHTIYWPIILMALGLELPKQIFAHPWILFDRNKMSKSKGNILYTDELIDSFGEDIIRYYVLHEIPFAQDGNITYELIIERNNSDLANTIGNLVQRTVGMFLKYQEGFVVPKLLDENLFEINLKEEALNVLPKMRELIDKMRVGDSLEVVLKLAREANRYIDITEPWNLNKEENRDKIEHVLYTLLETIRFIGVLLQPYMPNKANEILDNIKTDNNLRSFESLSEFGLYKENQLEKIESKLFERYDLEEKMEEILQKVK